MIKAHGRVRSVRTCSLGVECLEGRVVLSGAGHAAAGASAAVAAEQAALPPTLETSSLLKNGDLVTGVVMVFSKPLNPATAQDVNNYQVEGSIAGIPTPTITSAIYNASQDSVTLMLAQPFTIPHIATLPGLPQPQDVLSVTVPQQPSKITDTSGQPLVSGTGGMLGDFLCDVPAQGTLPNPLIVGRFSQSRLNAFVSKLVAVQSIATTNAAHPIHLTGTIHGTYYAQAEYGIGGAAYQMETKGAGSISPLGRVTDGIDGSPYFDKNSPAESFQYQERVIRNKLGTLTVAYNNLQWATSHSLVGNYTIGGDGGISALVGGAVVNARGTGAYAGAVGSGHVRVTWTGTRFRGNVTEIYS
jgi:hypothetical protein